MTGAGSLQDLLTEAQGLVLALNEFATRNNLTGLAAADHIGFKCDSRDTFVSLRDTLEGESDYMYQSIISGRRIAIMKLKMALETALGPIYYLELADQKPDGSQKRGFDHIEIFPLVVTYDELRSRLETAGEDIQEKIRPHHTTHDIQLRDFVVRLEREPLIEKIKKLEMI